MKGSTAAITLGAGLLTLTGCGGAEHAAVPQLSSPAPMVAPWAAPAVSPPAGLAAVVQAWASRGPQFAGCALYAPTSAAILDAGTADTNFGGSDQVLVFNELWRNVEVSIWPPTSESTVYAMFGASPSTRLADGTLLRTQTPATTDASAPVADWLLAIPGQRCFVEISATDDADWSYTHDSLRRIDAMP